MLENDFVDWQCKRPQSLAAVPTRLKEARKQLDKAGARICGGVIGLDCSAFIRPDGMLIEKSTSREASLFYEKRMKGLVLEIALNELRRNVLGIYLFSRAPSMIRIREFKVLTLTGKPYREVRPESTRSLTIVHNRAAVIPEAMPNIYKRLKGRFSISPA